MPTNKSFQTHLQEVFMELDHIYSHKTHEYSYTSDESFINIREMAKDEGCSPQHMCFILANKHWKSLYHNWDTYSQEQRREKISDIHLYIEYIRKLITL